jgi:hypothetical protein
MHNENQETAGDRADDIRAGVEAADDTGMVAQQELLHVVGDAETADDEREVAP